MWLNSAVVTEFDILQIVSRAGWRRERPPNRTTPSDNVQMASNALRTLTVLSSVVYRRPMQSKPTAGEHGGEAMGRQINELSARKSRLSLRRPAFGWWRALSNVTSSGARSCCLWSKVGGRRREMGLGSARDVPLGRAREMASEARQHLVAKRDPLVMRDKRMAIMSFREAAEALVESMSPSWRNAKHRAQWAMTLTVYCAPIADLAVADVTAEDVLRILKPCGLPSRKPLKATRAHKARARLRQGTRLALWGEPGALAGPSGRSPSQTPEATRGHHKAMPFDDLPEFSSRLAKWTASRLRRSSSQS